MCYHICGENMITEKQKQEFKQFSAHCRENHIPVVREQTANLLCETIKKEKSKNILEIGTAVGFSGTLMLLTNEFAKLTTIELDAEKCKQAQKTFEKYGVQDRVSIINQDALQFLENNHEQYDFIFVDGPKGQYIKYLPYLKKAIKPNCSVFCDDVLYFGMVLDDSLVVHKKITIVRNLRAFINLIKADETLESKLIEMEDGVLIFKKK